MEATKENVIKVTQEFIAAKTQGKSWRRTRDMFLERTPDDWIDQFGQEACDHLEQVFPDLNGQPVKGRVGPGKRGPRDNGDLFDVAQTLVEKLVLQTYMDILRLREDSIDATIASM